MNNKKYLIILLGILAIGQLYIFYTQTTSPSIKDNKSLESIDAPAEKEKWRTSIKKLGEQASHQKFKEEYSKKDPTSQHIGAHIYGEILYEHAGVKGVAICDSAFAFGCYHSFFAKALMDQGPSVVQLLDKACVDKHGLEGSSCQHGIGHGLIEYYGTENLVDALEFCKQTTQPHNLFGCTGGVFMEYNVPMTFADIAETIPRTLDKNKPFYPCPDLPGEFQESCYYELGQWWDQVYDQDYKLLGEMCQSLQTSELTHACFLGLGNVIGPSSNYDATISQNNCNHLPTIDAKNTCKIRASWTFTDSSNISDGYKVCINLPLEIKDQCLPKQ